MTTSSWLRAPAVPPITSARQTRRGLDPWCDPHPIRSEIFSVERFEDHAHSLADGHLVVRRAPRVVSLLRRLDDNEDAIVAASRELLVDVRAQRPVSPAAEWIIDNLFAVSRHVRQARRDLPPNYIGQLPKLGDGHLTGYPRVFAIVWAFVAHTDSCFDPDMLTRFLLSYQERKPLSLGELWAVPITLRLLLIENLRRIADATVAAALAVRQADQVADAVLGLGDDGRTVGIEEAVRAVGRIGEFAPFAVQLSRRLSGQEPTDAHAWLVRRLEVERVASEISALDGHREQSAAALTTRNIFTSLRLIQDVSWQRWVESVSLIERDLRTDAGYAALDFATRNVYRSAIERLARGSRQAELDVTRAALQRAQYSELAPMNDVGYWLIDDGRPDLEQAVGYRPPARLRVDRFLRGLGVSGYLGALTAATGVLVLLLCLYLGFLAPDLPRVAFVGLVLLASMPATDLALGWINYWSARTFEASILPGLALRGGVPEEARTMVVIPTLLSSRDDVEELVDTLEMHYLANNDGEIYFALLTDFGDWQGEHRDSDDELVQAAVDGILRLNETYGGERFLLLHRPRRFNPSEGVWMGWERKRGKLEELNRLLRGEKDVDLAVHAGRVPGPVRYVLTLDSDTRLPRDAARRLVGKLAHPLNCARLDEDGRVRRGYGILQPQVTPALPMREGTSQFRRIYSTRPGLDQYAFAVSDVYQDLFAEGSFAGKGIYDIDVVAATLRARIPENSLLSHDLLEGNYARSGLVTDVEVVEQHPDDYLVAAGRNHRWTRGDWQLLPWMLRRRRGISTLSQWKMVDNLRRSLTPIALVLAVLLGAATLPAAVLAGWLVILFATFIVPPLLPLASQFLRWHKTMTLRSQVGAWFIDLREGIDLGLVNLVFLAHHAWSMADAILRTLFRLTLSHRNLLEWTTAADAARRRDGSWESYLRRMRWSLLVPAATLGIAAWRGQSVLAVCLLPVLLWFAAPWYAAALSRPGQPARRAPSPETLAALRLLARRTWQFFDTFVTARENHLPPDNFQEEPAEVAHRTSPTNIGLYLLSTVSARDFGWIGLSEATERIEATMATVSRLDRHRGHLYNWIDTRTLSSLEPRYVSSVDSGNFAGHLIALAQSCEEWRAELVSAPAPRLSGLVDTVECIEGALSTLGGSTLGGLTTGGLTTGGSTLRGSTMRGQDAPETAARGMLADLRQALVNAQEDAEGGVPWEDLSTRSAALVDALIPVRGETPGSTAHDLAEALARTIAAQYHDATLSEAELADLRDRLSAIEETARREMRDMDFGFLFNARRNLLSVGFNASSGELDESCYDLLASEARLASFVAIAKGDVRTRHWSRLGRSVTGVGGRAVLQSWSGSMFEYLMPNLVMRNPLGSLLDTTSTYVVRRQMEYGHELGTPWGISEAAYNARDLNYTYQYSPFGVPGLGIVRGLADNHVIAPYATGLAAMVAPDEAVANFAALAGLGAAGRFGFYESLDFTPARLPDGQRCAVVKCYMSHHQGMTLISAHNVLRAGAMRKRFHADPMIRAAELLMQERAPRHVPVTHREPEKAYGTARGAIHAPPRERTFSGIDVLTPTLHHMSNGRLSLTLTPAGAGQLRWCGHAITRWRPDRTTDDAGDHIFLRNQRDEVWSATPLPVLGRLAHVDVRLAEDRALFRRRHRSIRTELEYRLSPESDAVVRRLVISNDRRRDQTLTLTTYAELVLGRAADDVAHPAFSKMFVRTEYVPELGALVAHRRPRARTDEDVWAAHLIEADNGEPIRPRMETDRYQFVGRGRTVRHPAYLERRTPANGSTGDVLDPIFSLSHRVVVPAGGSATVYVWTFAAGSREELVNAIEAHRTRTAYERAAMLAWTQSQVELRHLGVGPDEAVLFQALAGYLSHPHPRLQPSTSAAQYAAAQSELWPLSISGDLPIVLVRVGDPEDLRLVRQMVRAFEFWRSRRCSIDLVFLNSEATSYIQELAHALTTAATGIRPRTGSPDSRGRIFVVRTDHHPRERIQALVASAAVVLDAHRGDLGVQLPRFPGRMIVPPPLTAIAERAARASASASAAATASAIGGPAPGPTGTVHQGLQPLLFHNSYGGFSTDGREYVTVLEPGRPTPHPWSNVIANEQFGFIATSEGSGSVWWRNSRDNQITPWHNDPVSAPVSEAIYVRDQATGRVSTPTAAPIDDVRHLAWHGFGYTAFLAETPEMRLDLVQFVPTHDAVKIGWLKLTNLTDETRRLTVTSFHDLVLGNDRQAAARHLISQIDEPTGAFFVRNPWSTRIRDQVVFVDLAGAQDAWTGDRTEFLGTQGTLAAPAAVVSDLPLSGQTGAGLDPCAALQQRLDIGPRQTRHLRVLLGAASDEAAARELVRRYRDADPLATLTEVKARWSATLEAVQVSTPDKAFDTMMNGWLLYQTISSRILARCAYYQASGAFGFRDQLQDGMSLVLVHPELARAHLLRAAGRQFPEGDVQHWWLPEDGAGIRTRITDDVAWLAYALARYLRVTGDHDVLDELVPYLEGEALGEDEHESFFVPITSAREDTLYAHCVAGLRHAFRYGVHGLPLIGTGDWNDGMNRVGERGQGESVWLGWFLHRTLTEFLPIVRGRGDAEFEREALAAQEQLLAALERDGWDGSWYRRGYFDDGTPLGSRTRPECRIDGIAQSWAVLSEAADPQRVVEAMDCVEEHLISRRDGIARLFTPPFETSEPDPGYVRSYPPGVRENGGQYSHAATWYVFAYAALAAQGLAAQDKAAGLFSLLNPINHARTEEEARTYRVEPYVLAADVYGSEPYVGRGGWTWYTGSSGWLYRAGLEAILGLHREADLLRVAPCLPADWTGASVRMAYGGATYTVEFRCSQDGPRRVAGLELDGLPLERLDAVPLVDDGAQHHVVVILEALPQGVEDVPQGAEDVLPQGVEDLGQGAEDLQEGVEDPPQGVTPP